LSEAAGQTLVLLVINLANMLEFCYCALSRN